MKIFMFLSILPPAITYYFQQETNTYALLLNFGVCALLSELFERLARKERGGGNLLLVVWLCRSFVWAPIAGHLILNPVLQIPWTQWVRVDPIVTALALLAAFGFTANSILLFVFDTFSAVKTKLMVSLTKDVRNAFAIAYKHDLRPMCIGMIGFCATMLYLTLTNM